MMKRSLPDIVAVALFAVLAFAYFFPADVEQRVLFQHDSVAGVGLGQEAKEYKERTGETTRWTNSVFGGMPTYQISPSYDSTQPLTWVQKAYRLFLPEYVYLLFILMLGFYILLRAFGLPAWYAALGGVVWAFSSYFCILISAGHIWKFITLAYIPPTIAGLVLAYRGKLLWGGLVTALFTAMQIASNHLQMSYYFGFVMLFVVGAYLVEARRNHILPRFFKATAVVVVGGVVGLCVNLSNLYHTYSYSKESMRGQSELVQQPTSNGTTQDKGATSGLSRSYITQWSYGIGETWTLLVPNYKGGSSSHSLTESSTAMAKADPAYAQWGIYQMGQYFGEQPGTSGPVYVGAFVLLLFVMGCFVVKGPLKWALLGATLFSILLSWGKNFMPLTDFFIDYVPMYNKFRAVSSILVIAEFTIPLLAILTLKQLLDDPKLIRQNRRALYAGTGVAIVALLLSIAPGLLGNSYVPSAEMQMLQRAVNQQQINSSDLAGIVASLNAMRSALVSSDALRSFIICAIGLGLLLLHSAGKLRPALTLGGIGLLCLIDLWDVNKRYLNDEQFVTRSVRTDSFQLTATDKAILADSTLDYRVLNMASNTFNENNTSYWHKSIGGYHPAKMGRYNDLINRHIDPEMQAAQYAIYQAKGDMDSVNCALFPVLNMLNTRYFILPIDRQGGTAPLRNPYACGNAWFVEQVRYAANANEELDALADFDPRYTAVADRRFEQTLHGATLLQQSPEAHVTLTSYAPNHLVYETENPHDGVALFSEIYYPHGWQVTIDGQPATLARANYVLRALYLPAGRHTVEMRFDPQSLHTTEGIAYAATGLLLVGFLLALALSLRRKHG